VLRRPFMQRSYLEVGMEYQWFRQREDPPPFGSEPSFSALTTTAQLTNMSDYLGYRVTTTMGFELTRRQLEYGPRETRTRGFIKIFAGVER
jgi:hypothetical protein